MAKDTIYSTPTSRVSPFAFNSAVARVFDDMIHRSVPMYAEIIQRQSQLVERYYRPGTRIYDLGCSTGNLALALCDRMPVGSIEMIAVDSSQPMLAIAGKRLEAIERSTEFTLLNEDILRVSMDRAGVVVVNFTLQFIPPADRDAFLKRIYEAMIPGGILLFSEKTIHPDQ